MRVAGSINPWSARLLLVLLLVLSFLVPRSGVVLVENALIARWEKYGFSPEDTLAWWDNGVHSRQAAIIWRSKGFPAWEIRQWRAMDIPPAEAQEWRDAGVDATGAATWRMYAFTPERAGEWMRHQFSTGEAIAWRKHGFEAEEAATWREKGMSPTGAVKEKRGRGVQ